MSTLEMPDLSAKEKQPPPRVRTAVGILVSSFPRHDQAYLLREINELERQGQPVVLIPLLRGQSEVVHEEAKPWLPRALYLPLFSAAIARANVACLLRHPVRYVGLLLRLTLGTLAGPRTLIGTLALFPKSVYLAAALPRLGLEHIHAHYATHTTTMAYIIASLSDLTFSFTVHGPDVFVHQLLLGGKLAKAKFVRAVSTFNKAFLAGLFPAVSDKIEVVHMGLIPEVYTHPSAEAARSMRMRVLSIAKLVPSEGFPYLIDACERLIGDGVDVDVTIVGQGPQYQKTEALIARHGLSERVHLLGPVPQHEMAKLLGDCDVFVLPSVIALDGQMDGIPTALMEAMAADRPIVASALSGIPELVENGVSGFLVDTTQPERVATALRQLAEDSALRERMGHAGEEKVRREFDVRVTAAAFMALLDRYLQPRTAAAERVAHATSPAAPGATSSPAADRGHQGRTVSLARTTARAAAWAFLSTAGAKAITLAGLMLLARLLAPHEFGLLAFALVYITYVETIGDLGSGVALVYWPDRRDDAAQVTFVVNAIAGVVWCGATIALAPAIAGFFHAPGGAPIAGALGWTFILKYLGNTHDALAQKDLRFRARLLPDTGLAVVSVSVALVLAWLGFGAWSLVWGRLAGVTTRTLLLWIIVPWRPSLRSFPVDLVKPMLRYGRGIIVVNLLAAVLYSSDLAIVGRFLGLTALGLYQMANKIPETTVIVLLWVVSAVLFPAFAKLHASGEDLVAPYLAAMRYVSALTIPAALGLSVLARPIVLVFFGAAWTGAAPVLAALAIYAALLGLSMHSGDVLKATGRAPLLAKISLLKTVFIVPALLIGVRFGATAVAVALAIAAAFTTVITLVITTRVIGVRPRDVVSSVLPSVIAGGAMAAMLILWVRWPGQWHVVAQLVAGVILGALVYGAVLAMIDPSLFRQAGRFLRSAPTLRGAAG